MGPAMPIEPLFGTLAVFINGIAVTKAGISPQATLGILSITASAALPLSRSVPPPMKHPCKGCLSKMALSCASPGTC